MPIDFAFLLRFLFLLFLLTACGNGRSSSTNPNHTRLYATSIANATRQAGEADGRIQIAWMVGLGDSLTATQQEKLNALAMRYNQTQTMVWLQLTIVEADEAEAALRQAIAAGTPPDIVGPMRLDAGHAFYDEWLDLRPYLSQQTVSQLSPQSVALFEEDGRLTGLPLTLYPSFIYYNRTLFDAANLPYPPQTFNTPYADGEPWNVDKMTQLAQALTIDGQGVRSGQPDFDGGDVQQFGFVHQWTDSTREGLALFGAEQWVDANGRVAFSDRWREGVHWTYEAMWSHRIYPNQEDQFSELFSKANTFRSGHVAMALAPLWFTCCLGGAEFEWDIAVVPSHKGETTAKLHADGFRIYAESEQVETAVSVLEWLYDDGYESLLLTYGGIPAQEAAIPFMLDQLNNHFRHDVHWQVALDSLAYADEPHHQSYLPNPKQVAVADTLFWSLLESDPVLNIEQEIDAYERILQALLEIK